MIESTLKQLESDIEDIELNGTNTIRELEGFAWQVRECWHELESIISARKNPVDPDAEKGISL